MSRGCDFCGVGETEVILLDMLDTPPMSAWHLYFMQKVNVVIFFMFFSSY